MADIVNYLQQINNAADDIEQIAKALKVLPKIEPYADNMLDSIIIIRANINCIQDIPHIYDKTVDAQPVKYGKWEHGKCTECKKSLEDLFEGEFYYDCEELHFCPNCGADMRGDINDKV